MFSPKAVIATDADGSPSVRAADLDGDGEPDILSASRIDDTIAWHENLGDGAFSGRTVFATGADAVEVHAADLDGDGDLDVLSASYEDDKIAWYENLGGSFSQQRTIATDADGAGSVHVADLDGDGDPDVVSASYLDDKIAWYENHFDRGDDHGDEPAAATLAPALPAFLHGVVKSGGDRDVFRVATGSGTLRAYSNGPMDTRGSLMSTSGTVLATDDDDGTDRNFRIEHDVAAGVHYIEVRGFNASATGRYTLSIEFVADTSQNSEDES
ncbi:MAG: VCBS repeat-containing protein [Proteobacteria bacterium]|nr:VCBS repeat-containing protein [Pseudomonadota bacterium]